MTEYVPDQATAEMTTVQPTRVLDGNLLEKIGNPDYAGWMSKKGEKYNSWKQRYFVLKGVHLYYLKSETVWFFALQHESRLLTVRNSLTFFRSKK